MTTAEQYRLNADNCAQMAEATENEPDRNRFKRMEAAWRALAEEQDLARREEEDVFILIPLSGPRFRELITFESITSNDQSSTI